MYPSGRGFDSQPRAVDLDSIGVSLKTEPVGSWRSGTSSLRAAIMFSRESCKVCGWEGRIDDLNLMDSDANILCPECKAIILEGPS